MKRTIFRTAAVILFLLPLACSSGEGQFPRQAPDLSLPDLDGRTVRLADFKGRAVLLNFFATWCPPCRDEIPDLIEIQKEYEESGLTVIGISLDQNGIEAVREFRREYGINYPVLFAGDDPMRVINKMGGFRGIPTTFFIDRQGMMVKKISGAPSRSFWDQQIKKLL